MGSANLISKQASIALAHAGMFALCESPNNRIISINHLLLSLANLPDSMAFEVMRKNGLSIDRVAKTIRSYKKQFYNHCRSVRAATLEFSDDLHSVMSLSYIGSMDRDPIINTYDLISAMLFYGRYSRSCSAFDLLSFLQVDIQGLEKYIGDVYNPDTEPSQPDHDFSNGRPLVVENLDMDCSFRIEGGGDEGDHRGEFFPKFELKYSNGLSMLNDPAGVAFCNSFDAAQEDESDCDALDDEEPKTERSPIGDQQKQQKQHAKSVETALGYFGVDLTNKAKDGELDPVVGRDREIDRLIVVLSRRRKNNPLLIGEAGVGKTAIVEGLAERIARGEVPPALKNKRVIQIDLAMIVAGTHYRGDLEARLKRIIDEIESDESVIAFIDEIHTLVGAGGSEGSMDAANILKPALARGKLHLIGATTVNEYNKFIENDAALTRRFQTINVPEPTVTDTVRIVKGIVKYYESFHGVTFGDSAIKDAVYLSQRYMPGRYQPDKAIDVIDETAAMMQLGRGSIVKDKEIAQLRQQKLSLTDKMTAAAAAEEYEQAATYKMRVLQLDAKLKGMLAGNQSNGERLVITSKAVAQTVSRITGVPVAQLSRSESDKLIHLEECLAKKVIGQSTAISVVARAMRRARSGINSGRRPIGSFIFLGQTGVGKTELARVLAEEMFGSQDNLIKLDMSEFGEAHSVARLIGAPAGYVGYGDSNQLVDRVRQHPYSVVLFDEIEKANPDIYNILLQILEDGCLTDGKNRRVDFSNCVIILTSNIGSEYGATDGSKLGFSFNSRPVIQAMDDARRKAVISKLKQRMKPELINRFDDIVVFNNLDKADVAQILNLAIVDLNRRLAAKYIKLVVTAPVRNHIIECGYSKQYGARALRREVQRLLEQPIADAIVAGEIQPGSSVKTMIKRGVISLKTSCDKVKVEVTGKN